MPALRHPACAARAPALTSLAILAGLACAPDARRTAADTPAAAAAPAPRPPGYVVDSVVPIDEALRRFQAGLTPATALRGGAPSRDALVARFVRALERGDTIALDRMELDRAEFAYLVYPSSPFTRPPYRQQPEVVWMLERRAGGPARARLLERYAGRPLGYQGMACDPEPAVEGENRLWRGCRPRFRPAGAAGELTGRLFGVIVERGGQFKFVNYANDL